MKKKHRPGYAPVYAAALYPDLAEIGLRHGYALAVHGSLAKDFDLIAVPWTPKAGSPDDLIDAIKAKFTVDMVGGVERKPHGRVAYKLTIGFGYCSVDLSFMPRTSTHD